LLIAGGMSLFAATDVFLETAMLKSVLAGATALAIAGTSLVYAQQPPAQPSAGDAAAATQPSTERARVRPNAEDLAALTDARIAGLKAGLKLSAEQEKNWPAVETAIRDLAKERADRMRNRAERVRDRQNAAASADMIERLRNRADQMTRTGSTLKRLADASEPLYRSLDDGQKRRLAMLSRDMAGGRGMHGATRRH
jgi:zinc resistance-associated protein